MWLDIGESVHRAGIRKMVIFNSHGGQPQIMDIVARELRVRHGMLVVVLSWFGFGLPRGIVSAHEQLHGIHGGEIETSMMMHLQPDLVRPHLAANFEASSVELAERFQHLLPEGGVGFGWMSHDLHPSGALLRCLMDPCLSRPFLVSRLACSRRWRPVKKLRVAWCCTAGATGNAAAATPEKGEALVEHAAAKLSELLAEVDAFPMAFFRPAADAGGWTAPPADPVGSAEEALTAGEPQAAQQ